MIIIVFLIYRSFNIKKKVNQVLMINNEQINEQKEELLVMNNQLIDSEKQLREANITKDKFFSIISHDLQTPFNAVIGYSSLLYNEFDKLDKTRKIKYIENVKEVSENKEGGESLDEKKHTWKKRKEGYLETLSKASQEALMVSCADKIHNLTSLIEDYENLGESIWNNFNASKNEISWFYKSVLLILKQRLNSEIVEELEKIYREAEQIMIK